MISYRPLTTDIPRELLGANEGKGEHMMVTGVVPAGAQAGAAVFGVAADVKPPPEKRDDVVPRVAATTNGDAAKSDLNLSKMSDPALGRTVDVKA